MIPFSAHFIPRHREGETERGDQATAEADFEYLYDKPYDDRGVVRVAGPFTVESLIPFRTLGVEANDELIDHLAQTDGQQHFLTIILENLNRSGVQQAHREDRISFTVLTPWPRDLGPVAIRMGLIASQPPGTANPAPCCPPAFDLISGGPGRW